MLATINRKKRQKVKTEGQYNRTPVGPFYTEEQRKKLRDNIPHGVHPKATSRYHRNAKSSYYVPLSKIAEDRIHPYDSDSIATRLIATVSDKHQSISRRAVWEKTLLDAWFHLYGEGWREWRFIIPWLSSEQVVRKAMELGCGQVWNWMTKRRFLNECDFAWSLEDLDYLIDRYPDRQVNEQERGIFVSNKPFSEIQRVAHVLGLPTRKDLDALTEYARGLAAS